MRRLFSKKFLFAVLCVFFALALTGCGAVLDTSLTADEAFNGQRVITARISNQNLTQYVTGGVDTLLAVAQENLPEQLTVSTAQTDVETSLIFALDFSGIDDYREKITAVLEGSGKDPSITFDYQNNEFKSGFVLSENFSSADLLNWYMDALEAADVVSSSRSNWYETGTTSIVFADTFYESRSAAISVREQTSNTLDNVRVSTILQDDGSFQREILFTASTTTVQTLAEGGLELGKYLQGLCPAQATFTEEHDEWSHVYTIIFSASSPEEIASMTDAVLQSDGNQFRCDITPADVPGTVDVAVTESYDASYYLNYTDSYGNATYPLERRLQTYSDAEQLSGDATSRYEQDDSGAQWGIISPAQGQLLHQTYRWRVHFNNVRFLLKAGASKSSAQLELALPLEMAAPVRDAAIQALEQSAKDTATLTNKDTETATIYTLSFSSQPTQALSGNVNLFLYAMSGELPVQSDGQSVSLDDRAPLFLLEADAMASARAFTAALEVRLSGDFSSLSGDTVEFVCTPPALGSFELTQQFRVNEVPSDITGEAVADGEAAENVKPGALLLGPGNFSLKGVYLYPALGSWLLLLLAILCAAACLFVVLRNRVALSQSFAQLKQQHVENKAALHADSVPMPTPLETPEFEQTKTNANCATQQASCEETPPAQSEEKEEEFL